MQSLKNFKLNKETKDSLDNIKNLKKWIWKQLRYPETIVELEALDELHQKLSAMLPR